MNNDSTPLCISSIGSLSSLDLEFVALPSGNTGAQNAGEGGGSVSGALVDWLSFTFPTGETLSTVFQWVGAAGWLERAKGRYGYKRSATRGGVTVLWDGAAGMGVHVEITGQGCRELEADGIVQHWPHFLSSVLAGGMQIARLDLALDDREGLLDLARIEREAKGEGCVSRFKSARALHTWEVGRSQQIGDGTTLYFGSPTSKSLVRFYDKAAQMDTYDPFATLADMQADIERQGFVHGHWVRCEMQFRDRNAQLVASLIASENWMAAANRVLYSLLDFKQPGASPQKTRWKTAEWWAKFVDCASKWRIGTAPAVRSVQDVYSWVLKQVAPSLAILNTVSSDGRQTMLDLIHYGYRRWQAKHAAIALSGGTVYTSRDYGQPLPNVYSALADWEFYERCIPKCPDGWPVLCQS